MKTPEQIARLERIEQVAHRITMEIRESEKFGQKASVVWVKAELEKALADGSKPKKGEPGRCAVCGYPQ